MGALEVMRQVDIHVDSRHRALPALGLVLHSNRVGDILDANFLDVDPARIMLTLYVFHGGSGP